jgi:hypothetical protein
MMHPAYTAQITSTGDSAFVERAGVIEVAAPGRLAAGRGSAGHVAGDHLLAQPGRGPVARGGSCVRAAACGGVGCCRGAGALRGGGGDLAGAGEYPA